MKVLPCLSSSHAAPARPPARHNLRVGFHGNISDPFTCHRRQWTCHERTAGQDVGNGVTSWWDNLERNFTVDKEIWKEPTKRWISFQLRARAWWFPLPWIISMNFFYLPFSHYPLYSNKYHFRSSVTLTMCHCNATRDLRQNYRLFSTVWCFSLVASFSSRNGTCSACVRWQKLLRNVLNSEPLSRLTHFDTEGRKCANINT